MFKSISSPPTSTQQLSSSGNLNDSTISLSVSASSSNPAVGPGEERLKIPVSPSSNTIVSELSNLVDDSSPTNLINYHGLDDSSSSSLPSTFQATSGNENLFIKRTLGFRPINKDENNETDVVNKKGSGQSHHHSSNNTLDFKFLKRFLKIHYLLFSRLGTDTAGSASNNKINLCSWLFLFLVALCLLNEYIIYNVGLIPSKYYKVLGGQDLDGFWRTTLVSSGFILAVALVKSTKQFVQKLLTAGWRQILTKTIHVEYFKSLNYYKLNVLDQIIDNPDQRMTQDVDKFTSTYCDILPKFILAPFLIGYYSYEAFTKSGWIGPTACFGFFVIDATFNRLLMGPVIKYVVKQEKYEGNFRFIHMLIRINSESLAFHNASELELLKTNGSFDTLIKTQYRLYIRQYFLNISINLFEYFGSILSYLLLAIPIFSGDYDNASPGDISVLISQNSFVTMYLIFQFTSLVEVSTKFADVTGVSHRIGELIERLQLLDGFWKDIFKEESHHGHGHNNITGSGGGQDGLSSLLIETNEFKTKQTIRQKNLIVPVWSLNQLSFKPPFSDVAILRDLTMTINTNQSLLIIGPSSSGKSSLFRILRGLWPISHGSIIKHFASNYNKPHAQPNFLLDPSLIYYSPQKSYLTAGSLLDQITFPLTSKINNLGSSSSTPSSLSSRFHSKSQQHEWVRSYLTKLQLTHLLDRVNDDLNQPIPRVILESLSPGEIQRLCILRIFYHAPLIALLDEATSALPIGMEEIIYEECRRLRITTISVGHRESLKKYHDVLLSLDGRGGWSLENLNHAPVGQPDA